MLLFCLCVFLLVELLIPGCVKNIQDNGPGVHSPTYSSTLEIQRNCFQLWLSLNRPKSNRSNLLHKILYCIFNHQDPRANSLQELGSRYSDPAFFGGLSRTFLSAKTDHSGMVFNPLFQVRCKELHQKPFCIDHICWVG